MENRVQKYRKAKGLSQKQLAELVGTSQQQIQRIENGLITAKLEMAAKLAQALEKPLNTLFPGAGKALKAVEAEMKGGQHLPQNSWADLQETGIDIDPRNWTFLAQMRGHADAFQFEISGRTRSYLWSRIQDERDTPADQVPFAVFDTFDKRIALNLSELIFCQFLFDIESAEESDVQPKERQSTAEVYFKGLAGPLLIELNAEYRDPDDPENLGQCQHIFFMLTMDPEPTDRYLITDFDGEDTFIRVGDVSIFAAPLDAIEAQLPEDEE